MHIDINRSARRALAISSDCYLWTDYSRWKNFENHREFIPHPSMRTVLSDREALYPRWIHSRCDTSSSVDRRDHSLAHFFFKSPSIPRVPYRSYFTNIGSHAGRKVFPKFPAFKRPRAGILQNLFSRESTGGGDGGDGDSGNNTIYLLARGTKRTIRATGDETAATGRV